MKYILTIPVSPLRFKLVYFIFHEKEAAFTSNVKCSFLHSQNNTIAYWLNRF